MLGFAFDPLGIRVGGRPSNWMLCLGAGVSAGIIPTWNDLSRRIVNEAFGESYSDSDFAELVARTGWPLSAWIQAAYNHSDTLATGIDVKHILEEVIYSNVLGHARARGVEAALIEALNNPRVLSESDVRGLCDRFESAYADTPLMHITRFRLRV